MLDSKHTVTQLTAEEFHRDVPGLAEVLADSVEGGASIGFLDPFGRADAAAWWLDQAAAVADGRLLVWVSRDREGISGTISLAPNGKANGRHRAEVSKLLVHRRARGQGLGRALLTVAEQAAAVAGRTLLLLDTQTGSPAESLYLASGWTRFGIVPDYAGVPDGTLSECSFFYKQLR